MRIVSLLFFITVTFALSTCTPKPQMGLSQERNDSLEYYFRVANDDSLDQMIRAKSLIPLKKIVFSQRSDSAFTKNLFRLANRYWNNGRFKDYMDLCDTILAFSVLAADTNSICKATLYKGNFCLKQGLYDQGFKHYDQVERLSLRSKNKEFYFRSLIEKADLFMSIEDYQRCEATSLKGLKSSLEQDLRFTHYFWNYLGLCDSESEESSSTAISSFRKAIVYLKYASGKDQGYKATYINNLGCVFLNCKSNVEAIKVFKDGLKVENLFNQNPVTYAMLLENLNFARFNITGEFSLRDNDQAANIKRNYFDFKSLIICKVNRADYYTSKKMIDKSNAELDSALVISKVYHLPRPALKVLKRLILQRPEKSQFYALQYMHVSDSLQLAERRLRNKFARIEYETDELKEQNQHLLTYNQKLSIGGTGIVALLVAGLFVRHYRARKKELLLLLDRQAANEEIYGLIQQQQQKVEEGRRIEKQRISKELHDGVMGKLSGVRLNLFILTKRTDPQAIAHCLEHIDKLQDIEKEIRNIAYDLDSPVFEEGPSFHSLINAIFSTIESHSETRFDLRIDDEITWDIIPNTLKMQLYRVIQEALNNIDKYAAAKAVSIRIKKWNDRIVVRIADNGKGFVLEQVNAGMGLKNMEARVANEGGAFKIKSAPEKGTTIVFTLPIN